jgi:hypothetical protein
LLQQPLKIGYVSRYASRSLLSVRFKQPFTLCRRRMLDGTRVYYYRYYDEQGQRSGGRSTGVRVAVAVVVGTCQLDKSDLVEIYSGGKVTPCSQCVPLNIVLKKCRQEWNVRKGCLIT